MLTSPVGSGRQAGVGAATVGPPLMVAVVQRALPVTAAALVTAVVDVVIRVGNISCAFCRPQTVPVPVPRPEKVRQPALGRGVCIALFY